MKKAAILTLYSNYNFGNKLQNYAIQVTLNKLNVYNETVKNIRLFNNGINMKIKIRSIISFIVNTFIYRTGLYTSFFGDGRCKKYYEFNKNINYTKKLFNWKNYLDYDYYLVGSDQVWNPFFGLDDFGLLNYIDDNNKKIAFSASIGIDEIPKQFREKYSSGITKFKKVSVRENKGKEIVEELTNRRDVEVLIDPTMLLTPEEWDKVSKRPKQLDSIKGKKYILNYFLGELSTLRRKEIERIAKENNCHIINILDKKDPFYICGPSEFLYLEKNAFLICTDSFHSSVFAILYNRPFVVFEREDKEEKMNSRIDTLLNIFKLKNRRYNGKNITKDNLEHDYTKAYKILELEREKSRKFLEKSLDIK